MPGNLVPETVPKLFSFTFGILGIWKIGGLPGIPRKASDLRAPVAHSVPDFRFPPVSSVFAPYAWLWRIWGSQLDANWEGKVLAPGGKEATLDQGSLP